MFDRVEPLGIRSRTFEQPVARAQAALQGVDAGVVAGVDGEGEPVEKSAALRGRAGEQAVHGGGEPHHAEMVGERGGGGDRLAIDAALAIVARAVPPRRLEPGAERREPERPVDLGRHRPRAVAFRERHLFERRAAQSAARAQERDRLDQVGLAGAVRADEHDRSGPGGQAGGVVAAEIRERKAADTGGIHGPPL